MHTDPLVYVVDNDQAMIESLSWLLQSVNLNVKTYKCTIKFLAEYDPDQHSCILLDVRMSDMSGPELQKKFNNQNTNSPIIFTGGHVEVPLVIQTMRDGAVDFLIKPFNDKILIDTILKALFIDKNIRAKKQENHQYNARIALLSQREMQVLEGILASQQNKIISEKLNLSLKTVEAHRASMMKKMNVSSIVDLIKMVVLKGL